MSNHQASEQMIGYLYQVRYALALLLDDDNSNSQISIEKFDDVALIDGNVPKELVQLKHHVNKAGNLTDKSTDLWRTLKVWLDLVSESPDLIAETNFLIITTASAPDNTVAASLKKDSGIKRTPDMVDALYQTLKDVCTESESQSNRRFYEAFLSADENLAKCLINKIYVLDNANNIIDVEKRIRKQVRISCTRKYENKVMERLEGWWYRQVIEGLYSDTPIFISQDQVINYVVSTSQEYANDNLPIDIFDLGYTQADEMSADDKTFYQQLKLICLGNHHLKVAVNDYYRAFNQRASWVRNNLLYIDELDKYERWLIDEWEREFAIMADALEENPNLAEDEKVKAGKQLLTKMEEKDIRIREKCQAPFVMRGSYHILADQRKVGWHIDFEERLKQLLGI